MLQNNNNTLILIVNDNLDDLRQLGQLIMDQGEILFATSGKAGLFMAQKHKPDLIIVDFNLTDLSGPEFCNTLKSQNSAQHHNVVMVSATQGTDYEIASLDAGAIDFICKPYSSSVVKARIRNHAYQSREQNLLHTLANKDGLTEVYNRRYFDNQSRLEIKRHYRQQHPLALALLDIDNFKAYNDAYGHLQGDVCLREVAQALFTSSRRPGEFVSRYGGEEFAVILPNTDLKDAKKYGEWICERVLSLAIPHTHSRPVPFVTISVGVVSAIPSAHTSIESMINTADSALYQAKAAGRNQFKAATIENESIQEAI